MPNPFDFAGPQFLICYIIYAVTLNLIYRTIIDLREQAFPIPKMITSDPYLIAFLRGGLKEAIAVTTISLIDRGLLNVKTASNGIVTLKKSKSTGILVRREIETYVLELFNTPVPQSNKILNKSFSNHYTDFLITNHLWYSSKTLLARVYIGLITLSLLIAPSIWKINLALERGKHNYLFLIIATVISIYFLYKPLVKKTTSLGDTVLNHLRKLFEGLYRRRDGIKSNGQTNELAMLAAVFGIETLAYSLPYITTLFPEYFQKPYLSHETFWNTNCGIGSSCSSSSCAGSSCGGGGSGCGGCGGD